MGPDSVMSKQSVRTGPSVAGLASLWSGVKFNLCPCLVSDGMATLWQSVTDQVTTHDKYMIVREPVIAKRQTGTYKGRFAKFKYCTHLLDIG